ncbi:LCP family protein [Microbacteriaceae bacterium 4G12]
MKRIHIVFILLFIMLTGCKTSQTPAPSNEQDNNQTQPQDFVQHSPFHGVKNKQGLLQILIVGVDSRGEKQSRSDAIMVAQYNSKTKKAKLVSIMRDCYVKIPSPTQQYNKINMAYYYGGAELLRKTIKENFNLDVEHFVAIDFQGFIKVVDMIAPEGIEVNVKQTMIDDMGLHLAPGLQRLHGKDLLAYTRFRHDAESDFGRVKRQQEVLHALKDAFTNKTSSLDGMFHLPGMGQELLKYIDTDMKTQTLLAIGGSILLNPINEVKAMRVPVDSSYTDIFSQRVGAALQLDLDKNRAALKEFFIYEPTPVHEQTK